MSCEGHFTFVYYTHSCRAQEVGQQNMSYHVFLKYTDVPLWKVYWGTLCTFRNVKRSTRVNSHVPKHQVGIETKTEASSTKKNRAKRKIIASRTRKLMMVQIFL